MRTFNVSVNGTTYQVQVEEVNGSTAALPAAPAPVAAPQPAAAVPGATAPDVHKPAATVAGGHQVKSPMPGTIMAIKVKQGDSVKKGTVLCILEAMKMENEIMAPADGTVAQVVVSKGASVNAGDVLLVIS
jgi:biotin carboxyl carrier protein